VAAYARTLSHTHYQVAVGVGVAFGPFLQSDVAYPSEHSVFSFQRFVKSFTNA